MKTPKYSYRHRQHHHQANFLQLKLSNDDELPHRISELPDEVLCCILSHLSLQEAARTTILSCRWRYVWKRMMSWTFDTSKVGSGIKFKSPTQDGPKLINSSFEHGLAFIFPFSHKALYIKCCCLNSNLMLG